MNRRGLLLGILGAASAPAFVRGGVLMPLARPIWTPGPIIVADFTREVLRVAHSRLDFIGSIEREYSRLFAERLADALLGAALPMAAK